jgi:hypothetical protein
VLEESDRAQIELDRINSAREDLRVVKLRTEMVAGLERAMHLWSTDVETADVGDPVTSFGSNHVQ